MPITERKTFVYGDFTYPREGLRTLGGVTAPPGYTPYAIEILREFSAFEFIGKVYRLSGSQRWEILDPEDAKHASWYEIALKGPATVKFDMQGSGVWTVQNVRIESDDRGRYIAVALSTR
jgi:hypothetical protein